MPSPVENAALFVVGSGSIFTAIVSTWLVVAPPNFSGDTTEKPAKTRTEKKKKDKTKDTEKDKDKEPSTDLAKELSSTKDKKTTTLPKASPLAPEEVERKAKEKSTRDRIKTDPPPVSTRPRKKNKLKTAATESGAAPTEVADGPDQPAPVGDGPPEEKPAAPPPAEVPAPPNPE